MTPKQTYLAWVRTTHPALYFKAVQAVFGKKNGNMGGLGDDLTDSITFSPDLTSTDDLTDISDIDTSSDVTSAVNTAYNATQSSSSSTNGGGTDFFSSLANAITAVAPTVVQTQAAENLLAVNTARAQQGLPPLSANGVPVTGSMLSPTSATIAQMEAALGAGGGILPILLIGGVGLLAFMMVSGRRS